MGVNRYPIKHLVNLAVFGVLFLSTHIAKAQNDSTTLYTLAPIKPILVPQQTLNNTIAHFEKAGRKQIDIYSRLHDRASRTYVTRKLFGLFIRRKDIELAGRIQTQEVAEAKFNRFANRRINQIDFVKLKSFGQSVFDTTLQPTNWLEKAGNAMHIRTATAMIRNNIFFKVGDRLSPIDFAESEQNLRSLPFLEDANILVEEQSDSTVNVKVITKDTWSMAVAMAVEPNGTGDLEIYEKNIAGLGIGFYENIYHEAERPSEFGHKSEMRFNNIGGTFVQGNFWLRKGLGYENYSMNLTRDFYSSKAQYGGGIKLQKFNEPYGLRPLNRAVDTVIQTKFDLQDFWLGRSFRVSRRSILKSPMNMAVALRMQSIRYTGRPEVAERHNPFFHSRQLYLASLSLTQQQLTKANLIYAFGPTEDIPTGFRVQLTSGIERGEFQNRAYISGEMSAAETDDWGYLFLSARAGGYLTRQKMLEQSVINLRATYFSNLLSVGKLDIRQFVRYNYTRGFARLSGEGEYIYLSNSYGVRGLNSPNLKGETRLVFNFETIAFNPLYVYGFRFAYFFFWDVGFIGSSDELVYMTKAYNGIGLGVRIRNENLVFNTLQIRFGYYPSLPPEASVSQWLVNGSARTYFENFRSTEPQIVPFQ